jgi:thioredoxin 1
MTAAKASPTTAPSRIIIVCPRCGAKNRVDLNRARTEQPRCARCHAPLPISAGAGAAAADAGVPREVTDDNLRTVLAGAGDRPVLVDAWAEWCPPCKMLTPTIDAIAAESAGRWVVGKLDIDQNPRTAAEFRISSIPTMLIFKNGQLVDTLIGLRPKPDIVSRLQQHAG